MPVSVAANVGTTPTAGLFVPSRRVIVTVEVALPFAIGDPAPVIVEFAAETLPPVNVTLPVTVVNPLGEAIFRVFVCATVEAMVPVATPDAFVVEAGWLMVFPVPLDAKVVVTPLTGLLFASRSVSVMVDVVVPSAVMPLEGEADNVELAAIGGPAMKVTDVVTPANPEGVAILSVFACATVEAMVPVATPEAFVTAAGWVSVFPVPVAAKVVETPLTGLPFASISVIVTVEVDEPSAVMPLDGEAAIVEFAARGVPATKATVALTVENPLGEAMLTVLIAATVEERVPVVWPAAFVTEPG